MIIVICLAMICAAISRNISATDLKKLPNASLAVMVPDINPWNDCANALPIPSADVMAMLLMLVRSAISSFSLPIC
jgi:hypothetical protein